MQAATDLTDIDLSGKLGSVVTMKVLSFHTKYCLPVLEKGCKA